LNLVISLGILYQEKAPLRSGAKGGQQWRGLSSAARTTRESRPRSGVLSFVRFIRRQGTPSCPRHCLFPLPSSWRRWEPVRSSVVRAHGASPLRPPAVAMGGLFGAVLSTPVGALIVSCEGPFCADAMLTVAHSVAAINSDCVFIICLLSRFLPSTLMSLPGSMAGSANAI
jgi:hypothetical protein